MLVKIKLNGQMIQEDVHPQTILLDWLRDHGCYSVKRGCETANCGLCTVWLDEKPILSCAMLVSRCNGHAIVTLEGMQEQAKEFAHFMANQGAEQCGFCTPGLIMNVFAMEKELKNPTEDEIKEYLAGNLCRCTGYMSQLRAIKAYLNRGEQS
ncbi:(2Fe-2S)-binding protein [Floccifex sp.]|uniref:(2Fe-2S)-binding protein n=1 Tax=Floccifex sp. TaxID=2815810 RepID=UPI003F06FD08